MAVGFCRLSFYIPVAELGSTCLTLLLEQVFGTHSFPVLLLLYIDSQW